MLIIRAGQLAPSNTHTRTHTHTHTHTHATLVSALMTITIIFNFTSCANPTPQSYKCNIVQFKKKKKKSTFRCFSHSHFDNPVSLNGFTFPHQLTPCYST